MCNSYWLAEVTTFSDCTADVVPKLGRLEKDWNRIKADYLDSYQRALKDIDVCAATYPDKVSIDRLMSCLESVNRMYFSTANATQEALTPSPTMKYFEDTVVSCARGAALAVASKGRHFLQLLLDCAALSGNIDLDSYAKQLVRLRMFLRINKDLEIYIKPFLGYVPLNTCF